MDWKVTSMEAWWFGRKPLWKSRSGRIKTCSRELEVGMERGQNKIKGTDGVESRVSPGFWCLALSLEPDEKVWISAVLLRLPCPSESARGLANRWLAVCPRVSDSLGCMDPRTACFDRLLGDADSSLGNHWILCFSN